ncbi:MAG: deoxyguanosinetriphosphate triphosphohydrolase [Planctomycetes bacterium]|nr:deoxyguanosinetriphosphate triphosphohydrolase [Planctomycetota bacterium]
MLLAPYAARARDSRGREHAEAENESRTIFQRDRDRIVHCTAFRRLEYKTQVFVNHEGDHYRTRLTHTLEVAQIARAVTRSLGLNEDLVEAIALSHDLGHPPFGHAGEEKLDELLRGAGGFNHNRQCLRIVTILEQRYPDFPGLNLCWEIREAIVKHGADAKHPVPPEYAPELAPSLEAQLVDHSDSLAYVNHDVDDGLRSGLLSFEALRELDLWREAEESVTARWPASPTRQRIARTISALIDAQIVDLIGESRRRIAEAEPRTCAEARAPRRTLIAFSPGMEKKRGLLREFLYDRLYYHDHTRKMAEKGKRFIEAIFREYLREPAQLPREYQSAIRKHGPERVICDYIAGMTDRFCNREYMRLFVPFADAGGRHDE